jgi:hypothetical protein
MAENKKNNLGELEKLALIADSLQTMFRGKTSVLLELNKEEYTKIITHFREVDRHHKQFTIDMSGTDFMFVLNEDML